MQTINDSAALAQRRLDWFGLVSGAVFFGVGAVLTLTLVGAIVGLPMVLAGIELLVGEGSPA